LESAKSAEGEMVEEEAIDQYDIFSIQYAGDSADIVAPHTDQTVT
jgi:hypothetical protein